MKNYFVVGASSGIGKSLSEKLSVAGHQVYATYNTQVQNSNEANVRYSFLDVLAEEYDLSFLPDKIDGFVYCPGSINLKPFTRIKPAAFVEDYKLQVLGVIRLLQAIAPNLKAADDASVVLFSTVAVQLGFNFHTQVATSKGALEGFTKSLAAEWAPAVRVNAIAPSLTDTPLAGKLLSTEEKKEANAQRHPLKKIGTPENIADLADFLLSDKSSWMTGQVIHLDGGMSSIK